MASSAVASRYANALVDVVTGRGAAADPQQVARELRSFAALVAESPELREVLTTPAVPTARKRAVVSQIAGRLGMGRVARNFVFVLIDHRRVAGLDAVIDDFEILLDERLGFTRAEISAAGQLSEAQRAAVVAQLERLTGKRVRPRFAVDETLIGGVVARIGSTVYDGSVRGQLNVLRRRLEAE
ncbi:MAG: ATP synthase F1 subunit delta [Bryobacteraceae bacterium]